MLIKNNEKGATMVETIMVLGVLGAMAVGAAVVANSMYDKYRMSRVSQQLVDLKKVVAARYVADGNYSDLKASGMISEKLPPNDMINGTSALHHAYKGVVAIKGNTATYEITFNSLPLRACLEMGIMDWMVDNTSDLVSMKINAVTFKWPWLSSSNTLPAQVPDVEKACKDDNANNITWVFQ